ncbi:hypothetical protein CNEONATC25_02975 [Clostridium neonatale]|nr:hypothetical protein CNEONATC25_02975 [Clostridium neonatale]
MIFFSLKISNETPRTFVVGIFSNNILGLYELLKVLFGSFEEYKLLLINIGISFIQLK